MINAHLCWVEWILNEVINLKNQLVWRANILLTATSGLEKAPLYRGGYVAMKVSRKEPKPGKQPLGHTNYSSPRSGKEFSLSPLAH